MSSFDSGRFSTKQTFRGGLRFEGRMDEMPIIFDKPIWFRVIKDDICLDVFYYLKNSTKLLILGQDALIEGRTELPYFYRSKWHDSFECSVVSLNDPSLYDKKGLTCGWWAKPGAFELSHEFLNELARKINVSHSDFVFYGASAGGFYALSSGGVFNEAMIIADIPQVDVSTSPYKSNMAELTELFGCVRNVFDFWNGKIPRRILYLQNLDDTPHTRTQLSLMIKYLGLLATDGVLCVEDFSLQMYKNEDGSRAHSPLSTERLIRLIRKYV